jgi:hypothetical protein
VLPLATSTVALGVLIVAGTVEGDLPEDFRQLVKTKPPTRRKARV